MTPPVQHGNMQMADILGYFCTMDDMAKQYPSLFYVSDLYNKDWVKHHIKKSELVVLLIGLQKRTQTNSLKP